MVWSPPADILDAKTLKGTLMPMVEDGLIGAMVCIGVVGMGSATLGVGARTCRTLYSNSCFVPRYLNQKVRFPKETTETLVCCSAATYSPDITAQKAPHGNTFRLGPYIKRNGMSLHKVRTLYFVVTSVQTMLIIVDGVEYGRATGLTKGTAAGEAAA